MTTEPFHAFWAILTAAVLAVLTLGGCQSHLRYDNAERLMQREDFNDAAIHARYWVEDALTTINNLELELERR